MLEGQIKMEEISNSRMMVIWWHVSDSAQYENSCPVMFVYSVRHVETRGAFPHQIKSSLFYWKTQATLYWHTVIYGSHKDEKYNNCVILSQLFFAMVNSYLIVYCAITCYILGVTFSPGNSNIIIIMYNIWLIELYCILNLYLAILSF